MPSARALHPLDTHVFLHRDLPPMTDLQELAAYRVGVLKGDFAEGYLQERLGADSVHGFATYAALFEAVKQERIKAFAADTPVARHHLVQHKLSTFFPIRANQQTAPC